MSIFSPEALTKHLGTTNGTHSLALPDMSGKTAVMGSRTEGGSTLMPRPDEPSRRKPGASGSPVRLADGRLWLFGHPTYRPTAAGLTSPLVDRPLDRLFESAVLGEGVELTDVWDAARALLLCNYDLSDEEAADLLSVSPGPESAELAEAVVVAVFGGETGEKTFTRWVRASLVANGLGGADLSAGDLTDLLAILVATHRTIPLTQFADACRRVDERANLEALI